MPVNRRIVNYMDEYCAREADLPDSIQGYVTDTIDTTETFHAGVKTTGGRLTNTVWLVVTSEQLVIVTSKLIDATVRRVPLTDIGAIYTDRVELPGEQRQTIEIETLDDTLSFELHDPDGQFVEALRTAVGGVPDPELADPAYPSDVDAAIQNCERVAEAAATARREGSFGEASDRYDTAVAGYRTVLERLPAGDHRRDAIEETLTDLEDSQQQLTAQQERRETLASRLTAAEDSFQTAVRAHLKQEQTVAKIRYRQARDSFEEALELVRADTAVLTAPIQVAPDSDNLAVSGALDTFAELSTATTDALASNEIGAVADLRARTTGPVGPEHDASESPPTLRDSLESAGVDRSDIPTLLALAWQQTEPVPFAARRDIQRRLEQATAGYESTL
jgi:tetratricopeptide (TPR) repeat protein